MSQTLDQFQTPLALVDLDRLERNLRRMQAYADRHGLALRPHAKTHKASWIGRRQIELGAIGLTVATSVEASVLAEGVPELLIAYPALGPRAHATALRAHDVPTLVALDSVDAVHALGAALVRADAGHAPGVLVELDVGMRRCGVSSPGEAIAIARACASAGLEYRGILFYPGHIRAPVARQDAELEALAATVARFREALGNAGLEPDILSGGSTPTAWRSHEIPGLTEIRPGTYVFNDRTTCAVDACAREDLAYTVLATVVSTAVPGQAVVDAGSKALSSDVIRAPGRDGFGELLDRPEVTVARMSEEHGVLDLSRTDWRPRVGERVRIVPNHVCVSVNLQTLLAGVRGAGAPVELTWSPEARGWNA